jgi:predicted ABC-type transport system involved in lysophospholipase L1 biosynthesis ATPase subunit
VETTLDHDDLVVATNLSRVIGSGTTAVRILDNVSLRVPRLSLFAINGPSGSGLSNAIIAERLVITEGTVKTHVNSLLTKLDLADRTQAAVLAWREGLVEGQPPG